MTFTRPVLLEALIGSAGILLAGLVTIPLTAWAVGASVNMAQGAGMSVLFFVGRFVWLALLRAWFERRKK